MLPLPAWWPDYWLVYLPLSLVGSVRWSIWLFRRCVSLLYRPTPPATRIDPVSVITPVYNEDPVAFRRALQSWIAERPAEIIAVIDVSDTRCVEVFNDVTKSSPVEMRLIVTEVAGKRPALVDGIRAARSGIVALADSDTVWAEGVIAKAVAPFDDPRVGGVGTRQNVINAHNLWQRLADLVLDLRYHDELRFLARVGGQVTCLSGRTAFYRRGVLRSVFQQFLHEDFLGFECNSGEDKRFTYLIQQQGFRCAYQHTARVYTFAPPDFSTFLKQRVRWARNSWRADLRALTQSWSWRHPVFTFFLLDRCVSPFTALLSPIFMLFAIGYGHWTIAGILAVWWIASRTVKLIPHILSRPSSIVLVPVFIPFTFFMGILKIHALVTINWQGWLTRNAAVRLNLRRAFPTVFSLSATGSVLSLMFVGLLLVYKASASVSGVREEMPFEVQPVDVPPAYDLQAAKAALGTPAGFSGEDPAVAILGLRSHVVAPGEDLAAIARAEYGEEAFARVIGYANRDALAGGVIEGAALTLPPVGSAPVRAGQAPAAAVTFDREEDRIVVSGAGASATLSSISSSLPSGLLTEVSPGEWYLTAPLVVTGGAALELVGRGSGGDVDWLKLKSDGERVAHLTSLNGYIYLEGTRVTSWDEATGSFDTNIGDRRAFMLAKNNSSKLPIARLDIVDSELSHLGFGGPESYGVSWRVSVGSPRKVTGTVLGSKFHDNYFGAYTFGATEMYFAGNEFFNNAVYGLDPHDDSNRSIIMYNHFHDNGSHGLILSKRCNENLIAYNVSSGNRLHGIMLDQNSNNNRILRNEVTENADGITIFESRDNIIAGNSVRLNRTSGIRLNGRSSDTRADGNLIALNHVEGNGAHGIFLYGLAERNAIQANNVVGHPGNGIYVRSRSNRVGGAGALGNILLANKKGISVSGTAAAANLIEGNEVSLSNSTAVVVTEGSQNLFVGNRLHSNAGAAMTIEDSPDTVLADNQLDSNKSGIEANGCRNCRFIRNQAVKPSDIGVRIGESSHLLIEDQTPGKLRFADTSSAVIVVSRSGAVFHLPKRQPVYASPAGTAFAVRPRVSDARVGITATAVRVLSQGPTSVRVAKRGNVTWTVAGAGSLEQHVSTLQNARYYDVTVDGQYLWRLQASDAGDLSFIYEGDMSEPRTFELHPR